jgi:hypothetical protein
MRGPLIAACGIALAVSACAEPATPAALVRDSAGVAIVESRSARWSDADRWHVDSVPALSIGSVGGVPEASLSGVVGALRLPSGEIAIADGTSRELRFFRDDGSFVRRFGRRGAGPGEFAAIQAIGSYGDSVWAYDPTSQRLTVVGPNTDGFRTMSVGPSPSRLTLVDRSEDDSFVFVADILFDPSRGEMPPAGRSRPNTVYLRVAPTGEIVDTLAQGIGAERIIRIGEKTIEVFRPMLSLTASHAVRGDDLVWGDQTSYELRMHGPDGGLRRILRRPDVDLSVDEAEYRTGVETRIAASPEPGRPGLRRFYEELPVPTTRPAYARLLVGPDGELWVQDSAFNGEARSWHVFDPDGSWLGVVEMPAGFRPTQVLDDEIIGVWRDELEVECVRGYALHRDEQSR